MTVHWTAACFTFKVLNLFRCGLCFKSGTYVEIAIVLITFTTIHTDSSGCFKY